MLDGRDTPYPWTNSRDCEGIYARLSESRNPTFLVGAFGVLMLIFEEAAKTERVPFRYYAMAGRTDVRRPWHDRHWAGLRLLLIVGKP
jgi:hypothetical protein